MCTKKQIIDEYRKSSWRKRLEAWCMFRDLRAMFDELDNDGETGADNRVCPLLSPHLLNGNGFPQARFSSIYRKSFGR